MTKRKIRDDLIAEANSGRDRFVRTMILEMYRLSGQMYALAELMTNYIGGDAEPETDEHRRAPLDPAPAPARPPVRSSAMALRVRDVGAAPAGTAERPPQPIEPATSTAVRDAGAVNQGEDRLAQKEEGSPSLTSAQSAQAGHLKIDHRNASRSAGEGPVLIPAGRTTPAIKSKPLDPRPGRVAGVTITAPGKVIAVDMENFVIACPGGDWQTSRPVAQIMERMKDGDTFGHDVLAEIGSMSPSIFADSKHRWTEELAKRGVEFVSTKGVGCRIRLAETA